MIAVQTKRLILRQWKDEDRVEFAALCADPDVMEFFPNTLTPQQSDQLIDRFSADISASGWGYWAAERKDTRQFIGFIGINSVPSGLPFAPCVDIGWRLASQHWGYGFATEGAFASLSYAFQNANLEQVVSMTPVQNQASEKVMQKIGMINSEQNFMHPKLSDGHTLQEHVLYMITKQQWEGTSSENS